MLMLTCSSTDYKLVSLTQGKTAKVSPEDFDRISRHKWQALWNGRHFYAVRHDEVRGHGLIYMHREVVGSQPGQDTDHRNRENTLDNTRENLRPASRSQNQANRGLISSNSIGYTGVRRAPSGKFFGVVTRLGKTFKTHVQTSVEAAAKARDVLAQDLFGQFASLTFTEKVAA
jgi:hypothetical protein